MNFDFTKQENGDYTATVKCPICSKETKIENVPSDDIFAWCTGALIQRAFPNMAIKDRECLIGGLCHDCQERMFSGLDCEPDEDECDCEMEKEANANA